MTILEEKKLANTIAKAQRFCANAYFQYKPYQPERNRIECIEHITQAQKYLNDALEILKAENE